MGLKKNLALSIFTYFNGALPPSHPFTNTYIKLPLTDQRAQTCCDVFPDKKKDGHVWVAFSLLCNVFKLIQ